jgi:predicted DNA-binding antitoxin AbrB/MazE fold protein
MSKVIDAVFENGVFRPLDEVEIKEHAKVTIKIITHDEWEERFNRAIEKIHRKTAQFPPEEIEADIVEAIREVRERKRGR